MASDASHEPFSLRYLAVLAISKFVLATSFVHLTPAPSSRGKVSLARFSWLPGSVSSPQGRNALTLICFVLFQDLVKLKVVVGLVCSQLDYCSSVMEVPKFHPRSSDLPGCAKHFDLF